jgi:hypothetical protein
MLHVAAFAGHTGGGIAGNEISTVNQTDNFLRKKEQFIK